MLHLSHHLRKTNESASVFVTITSAHLLKKWMSNINDYNIIRLFRLLKTPLTIQRRLRYPSTDSVTEEA